MSKIYRFILLGGLCAVLLVAASYTMHGARSGIYVQTNLVSDVPGLAKTFDPLTVNPWGIARSAGSPWWISNNGTGVSTIYTGTGDATQNPPGQQFVVTIQSNTPGEPADPTGVVSNSGAGFGAARFIFVTESGTIAAWNPAVDMFNALVKVDNSASGANYKGVTIATMSGTSFLYAANFRSGNVDVFNSNFSPVSLGAGAFHDPGIPTGYAPFNVQNIAGMVVVAFAKQDEEGADEVAGKGFGFVDVFSPSGSLILQLESGPWLNAPWGIALAPANFGTFNNDLIIGNFGSGYITAFNPVSGGFDGFLEHSNGSALKINGLWALGFGNGGSAGGTNELFFAAGQANEHHGVFGKITAAP